MRDLTSIEKDANKVEHRLGQILDGLRHISHMEKFDKIDRTRQRDAYNKRHDELMAERKALATEWIEAHFTSQEANHDK